MRVVVLGGYGHFGSIISRRLAAIEGFDVVVAGRDASRAGAHAAAIGAHGARIDIADVDLAGALGAHGPELVIHTAGPFQGRDYTVARASLACGAHYIDIADGRDFVCGIVALDAAARDAGRMVVSGASSVPALSSAVVDRYAHEFAALDRIDVGISAGGELPGAATVDGVLGYCGKPFEGWEEARPRKAYGWQRLRRHRFRGAGTRWLCDCDVPDLQLFPDRYRARTVTFGAGVELGLMHFGLWMLSRAARLHLIADLRRWQPWLRRSSAPLQRFCAGRGAMYVRLRGTGHDGVALCRTWELEADRGDGAQVPCMAAVALARKLRAGDLPAGGATPAVGLLQLSEYLAELRGLLVRVTDAAPPGLSGI